MLNTLGPGRPSHRSNWHTRPSTELHLHLHLNACRIRTPLRRPIPPQHRGLQYHCSFKVKSCFLLMSPAAPPPLTPSGGIESASSISSSISNGNERYLRKRNLERCPAVFPAVSPAVSRAASRSRSLELAQCDPSSQRKLANVC